MLTSGVQTLASTWEALRYVPPPSCAHMVAVIRHISANRNLSEIFVGVLFRRKLDRRVRDQTLGDVSAATEQLAAAMSPVEAALAAINDVRDV